MPSKNCLILSLLPKHPVKSGMQNTVFYLNKFLRQKNNTKFLNISSTNIIDPILNLKHSKIVEKKIQKAIETFKPRLIFVNSSKMLYLYRKILLHNKKFYKVILVVHDLYFFRKKFFKQVGVKDKTPLSNFSEVKTIRKVDYIIDYSLDEKKYLLSKKISKKKFIFTRTPINFFGNSKPIKSYYDLLYIGSNWKQNDLSLKWIIKNIIRKLENKKLLVIGVKKPKKKIKNVFFKSYQRKYLKKCKIGLGIVKFGSGRKVKIFEMLGSGIPVVTNINLKDYGLKSKRHYIYVKKEKEYLKIINKLFLNKKLIKSLSKHSYKWSKYNSNYKFAFRKLKFL